MPYSPTSHTTPATGLYRDMIGRSGLAEHQYYIAGEGTAVRLECDLRLVPVASRQKFLDCIEAEMKVLFAPAAEPIAERTLSLLR